MYNETKVFNINPMPKPRMVKSDAWKKRPIVLKYWAYKDELNLYNNDFEIKNGMSYQFVIKMPNTWPKKKKAAMDGQPHIQRPDLDNLIKALWDCLMPEDSHIWKVCSIEKVWGYVGYIKITGGY